MKDASSGPLAFLLKTAPVGSVFTGVLAMWTLFTGIIPSLPALLFNCLLGTLTFFLMLQYFKYEDVPWLSTVLRPLPSLMLVAGVFIVRKSFYHSPEVGVAIQIFSVVGFVFFGLLLGLKGYMNRWSD